MTGGASVDEYIASLRPQTRAVLEQVRAAIRTSVPDAEERISYGIPTVAVNGRSIMSFAGWKEHVAIYPVPDVSADPELAREIAAHRGGKGTLRFALGAALPVDLIGRVAALLAEQRAGP